MIKRAYLLKLLVRNNSATYFFDYCLLRVFLLDFTKRLATELSVIERVYLLKLLVRDNSATYFLDYYLLKVFLLDFAEGHATELSIIERAHLSSFFIATIAPDILMPTYLPTNYFHTFGSINQINI